MIEQLPLLSAGLPPLQLGQRVRVIAEDWEGEVVQIWPDHDSYAVFAWEWPGSAPGRTITSALPAYRRDELEAIDEHTASPV